jgi:hypothetical protein
VRIRQRGGGGSGRSGEERRRRTGGAWPELRERKWVGCGGEAGRGRSFYRVGRRGRRRRAAYAFPGPTRDSDVRPRRGYSVRLHPRWRDARNGGAALRPPVAPLSAVAVGWRGVADSPGWTRLTARLRERATDSGMELTFVFPCCVPSCRVKTAKVAAVLHFSLFLKVLRFS